MINVILSSANMGDVDETDFDLWTKYVSERIEAIAGEDVSVEQARFGAAGEDTISGATDEQREAIRGWLRVDGWDAFCGEAWETMRAEAEKAA